MAKNHLAKILADHKKDKQRAIVNTAKLCLDIVTIALNEQFGFGRDRINKLSYTFNKMFEEYSGYIDADPEYADRKVKERLEKIMGVANDET